jgi:hypothetical protein
MLSCDEQNFSDAESVIARWNKETETLEIGSWTLPPWQLPNYQQSITLKHNLDGPSLLIELEVIGQCLSSISITAKRDSEIGMASLVAWIKLLNTLAPQYTNDERNNFLIEKLGIDKSELMAGGSGVLGDYDFSFSETNEGNVLMAKRNPTNN